MKTLDFAEIEYKNIDAVPFCLEIIDMQDFLKLAQIEENWYYHQDIASQIACALFAAKPGEIIADVCAAPGGKSITTSQYMRGEGTVFAFDMHDFKVENLKKRVMKLGIDNIIVQKRDATCPSDESFLHAFDKVMCDVPCSGLGALRRRPEIKYKKLSDFDGLPKLQYDILSSSSKMLKKGGILQYSTCTLNPSENEEVVRKFLCENENFEPVKLDFSFLKQENFSHDAHDITIFPWMFNSDGFYVAQMRCKNVTE